MAARNAKVVSSGPTPESLAGSADARYLVMPSGFNERKVEEHAFGSNDSVLLSCCVGLTAVRCTRMGRPTKKITSKWLRMLCGSSWYLHCSSHEVKDYFLGCT